MQYIIYTMIFILGIIIGKIIKWYTYICLKKADVSIPDNQYLYCQEHLHLYELIPFIGHIIRHRNYKSSAAEMTIHFPLIEGMNGCLYIIILKVNCFQLTSLLFCFITSALFVLSIVDWFSYEIPVQINIFIFILSVIIVILDRQNWGKYILGFFCISLLLYLVYVISKGRAIGGGDIKLMAAAGLGIGAPNIIAAFIIACLIGSVIHLVRMKVTKQNHMLALGPYLSVGIFIAMLWGNQLVDEYLRCFLYK